MRCDVGQKLCAAISLLSLAALLISARDVRADAVVINGDGSTFAYPMYAKWIEEYQKVDPGVRLSYQSLGSGAGIHDVMLGTVDFGGTDGPLEQDPDAGFQYPPQLRGAPFSDRPGSGRSHI